MKTVDGPPAIKLRNADTDEVWYVRARKPARLVRLAAWLSRDTTLPAWVYEFPKGSWLTEETIHFDEHTLIKGHR